MSKNTSNINFGPMTSATVSGSLGSSTPLNLGYLDSCTISFEPTPININDGQNYQGVGLAKCEIISKQSDAGMIASASLMKEAPIEIVITDIGGTTYTCGPALANVKTERSFEAGEGHILTVTTQKYVANESDFIVLS